MATCGESSFSLVEKIEGDVKKKRPLSQNNHIGAKIDAFYIYFDGA